jgi:phospholipase/carboxylesterase
MHYMIDQPTEIEIETAPNPEFAVILMHGLGADANDFMPLVPELRLSNSPAVRFVFPNAPEMAVTGNNGYVMRSWYDILSFEGVNRAVDEAGLKASCERIRGYIRKENERGIPTGRIFLAGFSQGGAMTYTAGLTHPDKLAGLIVLSGYVPSPALIDASFSEANRDTPIFAAHGMQDQILPIALAEQGRDFALRHGCALEWRTYPMPHSVCAEEVEALREWFGARLSAIKAR